MILSQKSDQRSGEIHLNIGNSQKLTITYRACYHTGVTIKADHMSTAYLEKFLKLAQRLIFQVASEMPKILKSLQPHIENEILSLEIRDHFFSTMYIDTTHNEDSTINVKISASGG